MAVGLNAHELHARRSSILAWRETLRAAGQPLVTTNGCFDLFHAGHLQTLEAARALGGALLVLLNSDASVRRFKGVTRPYLSESDRAQLLQALRCVDAVFVFEQDTPLEALEWLKPEIHVKGGSYLPERIAAEKALLESWGGRLEVLPLKEGLSSTALIKSIWSDRPVEVSEGLMASAHLSGPSSAELPDSTAPTGSRYPWLDLKKLTTISIRDRQHLVSIEDFAVPVEAGNQMGRFLTSLPLTRHRTNAAGSLQDVVASIREARARKVSITWACGPHVVKYGLSRLVIDLMERGLVTGLATNGAGAIHDAEIALFGVTSEEMTGEIQTGRFGMARETGETLNGAAQEALRLRTGFGEALGRRLVEANAPHQAYSLLASAYRLGIPVTVHVAMGTDIVHAQPSFMGAATGAATQHDFQILASQIAGLRGGGVHLNIASSVVLPEVFLKCLTVANNLRTAGGEGTIRDFLTVTMDHQSEYRPLMNVVRRPTVDVGRGVELLGRVEMLLPLLAALLVADEPALASQG